METPKKRIAFIDLAKGVCIILVVLGHCHIPINFPGLQTLRMPLYFILSGLFFKDYGGFLKFLVKKTNKILIPFLFFYLTGYLIFYFFEWAVPGLIKTSARGILDVFTQRQFFNGPIWFLLCLFWANLMFCMISLSFKNEYIRAAIVLSIGAMGVFLGINGVFLPCNIDSAMTALPFFYFGYILHKLPLLYPHKYDHYNLVVAFLLFFISWFFSSLYDMPRIGFHSNNIEGNALIATIVSICSVLGLLLVCKYIDHLPVISYLGRYSIIVLCLHHLVYRPVLLVFGNLWGGIYLTAIVTILICWAMIPLCIKFIPHFVAQKDLINIRQQVAIE